MDSESACGEICSLSAAHAPGTVLAIVGATATGKSEVAELVAESIGGEIVSADSMQVYRGMDIGTAKVPVRNRRVPYHCIDIVDPGESYSAALFQKDARAAIDDVISRGGVPIVCGGTGLYVKAALDDMRFPSGEQEQNPVRERYERIAKENGAEELHRMLAERDQKAAQMIHPNNVRRVVRALEMLDRGVSYSVQASGIQTTPAFYPTLYFGLSMDRERLYARVNARVDDMMSNGLVDEVRGLADRGFAQALTSSQAIGYKEILDYLNGACTLDEAVESIKRSTRRYAKRQSTWFRRDDRIHWLEID